MMEWINDLGRLLARPRERQREADALRRREVEALEYLAKRREGQTNDANVRDCDRIDI